MLFCEQLSEKELFLAPVDGVYSLFWFVSFQSATVTFEFWLECFSCLYRPLTFWATQRIPFL